MGGTWRRWACVAASVAVAGCTVDESDLDTPGVRRAGEAPPAVDTERTPVAPMPNAVVIRADKITVDTLTARLVYAEKIEAGSITVDDLRQDQDPAAWASQLASHQLAMATLDADTVYAREIQVKTLNARTIFAGKAVVEDSDDDDDDDDDEESGGQGSGKGNGNGKKKD